MPWPARTAASAVGGTESAGGGRAVKTVVYYALGSLITLAVFFTFIELTTRTVSWARGDGFTLGLHELDANDEAITDIYQFHPFTGFTFRPGRILYGGHPRQAGRSELRINKQGFLSESERFPIDKAADEIRIAMIGASTTANVNLNPAENWPGALGELVQAARPESRITIINAAVPGYDTAQSIANLALRVMPFSPDIVIIYHGYNDLKVIRPGVELLPDYTHVHARPYGLHERQPWYLRIANKSMGFVRARNSYREYLQQKANVDLIAGTNRFDEVPATAARQFQHNIRMLIGSARAGGATVILSSFATLHDIDTLLAGGAMPASELAREELVAMMNFTPGLSLNGIFSGLRQYNQILHDLAQNEHTGWVDNAALVAHSDENFLDRVHFTAAGAHRVAENMLPEVLRLLPTASN